MYVCLECGAVFETPVAYMETHGLDCGPYEALSCCPVCGGAYVETMRCSQCEDWVTGKYIELDDGSIVCDNCYLIKDIEDMRW